MKTLLWVLNSTFAALLCCVIVVVVVYTPRLVPPVSLALVNNHQAPLLSSGIATVDLVGIYQHDPFGTVGSDRAMPVVQPVVTLDPVPQPPAVRSVDVARPVVPNFLPPLTVGLKGIMYALHERDHRVILADKKTKQEQMYKVGDTILDAEIIRIEPNQVMFMRSNGQQEVLFVTSSEALSDPLYARLDSSRALPQPVKKIDAVTYSVDPTIMRLHITNLAQFIDALDITTASKDGVGIGCRIGSLAPYSIGVLLGLQAGDVVVSVNDIPPVTTLQRLTIYQQLSGLTVGDTIQVVLQREGVADRIMMTYLLQHFAGEKEKAPETGGSRSNASLPEHRSQQTNSLEKLHKDNKNAMLDKGGRPTTLRSITS